MKQRFLTAKLFLTSVAALTLFLIARGAFALCDASPKPIVATPDFSKGVIMLSWSPVDGAERYYVEAKNSAGQTKQWVLEGYMTRLELDQNEAGFPLIACSTYTWKVRAQCCADRCDSCLQFIKPLGNNETSCMKIFTTIFNDPVKKSCLCVSRGAGLSPEPASFYFVYDNGTTGLNPNPTNAKVSGCSWRCGSATRPGDVCGIDYSVKCAKQPEGAQKAIISSTKNLSYNLCTLNDGYLNRTGGAADSYSVPQPVLTLKNGETTWNWQCRLGPDADACVACRMAECGSAYGKVYLPGQLPADNELCNAAADNLITGHNNLKDYPKDNDYISWDCTGDQKCWDTSINNKYNKVVNQNYVRETRYQSDGERVYVYNQVNHCRAMIAHCGRVNGASLTEETFGKEIKANALINSDNFFCGVNGQMVGLPIFVSTGSVQGWNWGCVFKGANAQTVSIKCSANKIDCALNEKDEDGRTIGYTQKSFETLTAKMDQAIFCRDGKNIVTDNKQVSVNPIPPTPDNSNANDPRWNYNCRDNFGGQQKCVLHKTDCAAPPQGGKYKDIPDVYAANPDYGLCLNETAESSVGFWKYLVDGDGNIIKPHFEWFCYDYFGNRKDCTAMALGCATPPNKGSFKNWLEFKASYKNIVCTAIKGADGKETGDYDCLGVCNDDGEHATVKISADRLSWTWKCGEEECSAKRPACNPATKDGLFSSYDEMSSTGGPCIGVTMGWGSGGANLDYIHNLPDTFDVAVWNWKCGDDTCSAKKTGCGASSGKAYYHESLPSTANMCLNGGRPIFLNDYAALKTCLDPNRMQRQAVNFIPYGLNNFSDFNEVNLPPKAVTDVVGTNTYMEGVRLWYCDYSKTEGENIISPNDKSLEINPLYEWYYGSRLTVRNDQTYCFAYERAVCNNTDFSKKMSLRELNEAVSAANKRGNGTLCMDGIVEICKAGDEGCKETDLTGPNYLRSGLDYKGLGFAVSKFPDNATAYGSSANKKAWRYRCQGGQISRMSGSLGKTVAGKEGDQEEITDLPSSKNAFHLLGTEDTTCYVLYKGCSAPPDGGVFLKSAFDKDFKDNAAKLCDEGVTASVVTELTENNEVIGWIWTCDGDTCKSTRSLCAEPPTGGVYTTAQFQPYFDNVKSPCRGVTATDMKEIFNASNRVLAWSWKCGNESCQANRTCEPKIEITPTEVKGECVGDKVEFKAIVTDCDDQKIEWYVKGVKKAEGTDYAPTDLTSGDTVEARVKCSCGSATTVSNVVTVDLTPKSTPEVKIAADLNLCSDNRDAVAKAEVTGCPLEKTTYKWFKNGTESLGTASTASTSGFRSGDKLKVEITCSEKCVTKATAENEVTITAATPEAFAVTGITGAKTLCEKTTASATVFKAAFAPACSNVTYAWKVYKKGDVLKVPLKQGAQAEFAVDAGALSSGDYTVEATLTCNDQNDCIEPKKDSLTVDFKVESLPVQPAIANLKIDKDLICKDTSAFELSADINACNGQRTIEWGADKTTLGFPETKIDNSSTKLTKTVSSVSADTIFTLKVTCETDCGGEAKVLTDTATVKATIKDKPTAPSVSIVPTGDFTLCPDDEKELTLTGSCALNQNEKSKYAWIFAGQPAIIDADNTSNTTNKYTAMWKYGTGSYEASLTCEDECGQTAVGLAKTDVSVVKKAVLTWGVKTATGNAADGLCDDQNVDLGVAEVPVCQDGTMSYKWKKSIWNGSAWGNWVDADGDNDGPTYENRYAEGRYKFKVEATCKGNLTICSNNHQSDTSTEYEVRIAARETLTPTISKLNNDVCSAENLQYEAGNVSACAAPVYSWTLKNQQGVSVANAIISQTNNRVVIDRTKAHRDYKVSVTVTCPGQSCITSGTAAEVAVETIDKKTPKGEVALSTERTCANDPVTATAVELSDCTPLTTGAYSWQYSSNGTEWLPSSLVYGNEDSYTRAFASANPSAYFRLRVRCVPDECHDTDSLIATSKPITIESQATLAPTITENNNNVCSADSLRFTAGNYAACAAPRFDWRLKDRNNATVEEHLNQTANNVSFTNNKNRLDFNVELTVRCPNQTCVTAGAATVAVKAVPDQNPSLTIKVNKTQVCADDGENGEAVKAEKDVLSANCVALAENAYGWQTSTNGGSTWTPADSDIAYGNDVFKESVFASANPSAKFRLTVKCQSDPCLTQQTVTATSNAVTVLSQPSTPTITAQPTDLNFCSNESVGRRLSVTANCSAGNISYQWKKNGAVITGATSSTYDIPQSEAAGVYNYKATVTCSTNFCGSKSLDSQTKTVTINPEPSTPTITAQPTDLNFCSNASVGRRLSISANCSAGNISYQWKKNGAVITGATTSTYDIPQSEAAGVYDYQATVTCTNSCGSESVNSQTKTVTISQSPTPQTDTPALSGNYSEVCIGDSSKASVTLSFDRKNNTCNTTGSFELETGVLNSDNSCSYGGNVETVTAYTKSVSPTVNTCYRFRTVCSGTPPCVTAKSAYSNDVKVKAINIANQSSALSADPATLCNGSSVTLTATAAAACSGTRKVSINNGTSWTTITGSEYSWNESPTANTTYQAKFRCESGRCVKDSSNATAAVTVRECSCGEANGNDYTAESVFAGIKCQDGAEVGESILDPSTNPKHWDWTCTYGARIYNCSADKVECGALDNDKHTKDYFEGRNLSELCSVGTAIRTDNLNALTTVAGAQKTTTAYTNYYSLDTGWKWRCQGDGGDSDVTSPDCVARLVDCGIASANQSSVNHTNYTGKIQPYDIENKYFGSFNKDEITSDAFLNTSANRCTNSAGSAAVNNRNNGTIDWVCSGDATANDSLTCTARQDCDSMNRGEEKFATVWVAADSSCWTAEDVNESGETATDLYFSEAVNVADDLWNRYSATTTRYNKFKHAQNHVNSNPLGICGTNWEVPTDDNWQGLADSLKTAGSSCSADRLNMTDSGADGYDCAGAGTELKNAYGFAAESGKGYWTRSTDYNLNADSALCEQITATTTIYCNRDGSALPRNLRYCTRSPFYYRLDSSSEVARYSDYGYTDDAPNFCDLDNFPPQQADEYFEGEVNDNHRLRCVKVGSGGAVPLPTPADPEVTAGPADLTFSRSATEGRTLSVTAVCPVLPGRPNGQIHYQWRKGNVDVGQDQNTYTIPMSEAVGRYTYTVEMVCVGDFSDSNLTSGRAATVTITEESNGSWSYLGSEALSGGIGLGTASEIKLTFGRTGAPFMLYNNAGATNRYFVKQFTGTGWTDVGGVNPFDNGASGATLEVSSGNISHIAYRYTGDLVKVKKFANNVWSQVGIGTFSTAQNPHLYFDSLNNLSAAYLLVPSNNGGRAMKYDAVTNIWRAYGSGQNFVNTLISREVYATTGSGTPYVIYTNGSGLGVYCRYFNTATNAWANCGTLASNTYGDDPDMLIDSAGNIYVSYYERSTARVKVKKYLGGTSWADVSALEPNVSSGTASRTALAINSQGRLYVGFRDGANSNRYTVKYYDSAARLWRIAGVAGFSSVVYSHADLAVNPQTDRPCAAFSDTAKGNRVSVMCFQ